MPHFNDSSLYDLMSPTVFYYLYIKQKQNNIECSSMINQVNSSAARTDVISHGFTDRCSYFTKHLSIKPCVIGCDICHHTCIYSCGSTWGTTFLINILRLFNYLQFPLITHRNIFNALIIILVKWKGNVKDLF